MTGCARGSRGNCYQVTSFAAADVIEGARRTHDRTGGKDCDRGYRVLIIYCCLLIIVVIIAVVILIETCSNFNSNFSSKIFPRHVFFTDFQLEEDSGGFQNCSIIIMFLRFFLSLFDVLYDKF